MKKQAIQNPASLVPLEIIQNKIYFVRGCPFPSEFAA